MDGGFTYTPFTLGSRTVLRVDVNADGSVPNRSIPPRTGPPRGGSLHRSVTVPFEVLGVCQTLNEACGRASTCAIFRYNYTEVYDVPLMLRIHYATEVESQ